jgi:hypothetical protein
MTRLLLGRSALPSGTVKLPSWGKRLDSLINYRFSKAAPCSVGRPTSRRSNREFLTSTLRLHCCVESASILILTGPVRLSNIRVETVQ